MTNNNNQFIKIHNDFITDGKYDSRDHFVYAMIKSLSQPLLNDLSIVSAEILLKALGYILNTKNKTAIRDSIQKLIDNEVFEAYADINCTEKVKDITLSETYFIKQVNEDGYFTKLHVNDFRKLLTMNERNKIKIFTVYIDIISKMYESDGGYKYVLTTTEEIVARTGMNKKTIPKYIQTLMDNKLIYYKTYRTGRITRNVFTRWKDRKIADAIAERKSR